jgi:diguanylate cyclase (GGDEF)-like protein
MERQFDVMIVELDVQDAEGIATLAGVRGAAPTVPVVVYTRTIDEALALRVLRAGAQECLVKSEVPAQSLARVTRFAIERQRRLATLEAARIEAAHRATHDPLTGLANRELFLDHLDRALAFGARYGRKTGLLFVDLDGFKAINDSLGHAAGDVLLQQVASRLLECVRKSDSVARLGGDEFVVLLPDVTSRRDLVHVRDTILECLAAPLDLGVEPQQGIEASVGAAMSPLDGSTAQDLLDAADLDMYRVKYERRRGRMLTPIIGVAAINPTVEAPHQHERSVPHRRETRLRQAITNGQFEVHFQPMIDVIARRLTGAEALLRWRDPDRGLVGPLSFLPLAEDTGLVVPIGELVLREACKAVVHWRSMHRDLDVYPPPESHCHLPSLRVSVNLSSVQLREREFDQRVAEILAETGCPADALTFELTESSTLVDGDVMLETLRALKQLGIQLIVDDFGVGYASLTFLREAPIDGIKIDRRFVANMLYDRRDAAIVSSLVRLARGLSLGVTAEGVEGADQSQRLARLQCFEQQGRYFSDAIPRPQFEAMLDGLSGLVNANGDPMERWALAL